LEFAIALGAGFVARGFCRETDHAAGLVAAGVRHKGFAIIDLLQPCVSYNHVNTYQWYGERVYKVEEEAGYDPSDKDQALRKAREWGDRIPIGVIYRNGRSSFEEKSGLEALPPLVDMRSATRDLSDVFEELSF
jgi:2-oxoglutarate ferredoxin oxidoreductase subunit beta